MKEDTAYSVMELTPEQGRIILHDDKLTIRAQKVDHYRDKVNRKGPVGIGLTEGWKYKDAVKTVLDHGEPVIVNYLKSYTGETGEQKIKTMKPENYEIAWQEVRADDEERIRELASYNPQPLRGVELADGIYLRIQDNRIDLRICNLFDDLRSRYKIALESCVELIDAGVFKYEPRSDEPEPRNRVEAMRNRIKKYGKIVEYEHDVLFVGELGRAIYNDLKGFVESKPNDMAMYAEAGTIYLQGVRRVKGETKASCKYYDIGKREHDSGVERFKLETTLLGPYFKENEIGIEDMLEADRIQEIVSPYIGKIYRRYLEKVGDETMRAIQAELGLGEKARVSDIVRETFKPERTLTQRMVMVERRLDKVEQEIAALKRDRK